MFENSRLKIGKISYLNIYPVFYYLEKSIEGQPYEFIPGVPSWLNQLVRSGGIDVSPSSSVEYLRNPTLYNLVECHSISSEGPVGSIILFSRVPIEGLHGKRVLTSTQSETSVVLLDVLLKEFFRVTCSLTPSSKTLKQGLDNSSHAYLLIGDDALYEAKKNYDLCVYDLGQIWHEMTGLPFVYALWICNKEGCFGKAEALKNFQINLDMAKNHVKKNLVQISDEIGNHPVLTRDELISYWQGISYDLTEKHKKGLDLFRKYAKDLGYL